MSSEIQLTAGKQTSEDRKRSFGQRARDATFGDAFFISYTRRDEGKEYAEALARHLRAPAFSFFDCDDYAMGDGWNVEGNWAPRRTSQLLLIASPEVEVERTLSSRTSPPLLKSARFLATTEPITSTWRHALCGPFLELGEPAQDESDRFGRIDGS